MKHTIQLPIHGFIYTLQWDLRKSNKLLIQVREINVLTCVRCRFNISH